MPPKSECQQTLLSIKQVADESMDKYAERVHLLMKQCSTNSQVQNTLGFNAFVSGILNSSIKLKLLESGITDSFTDIVAKAKQLETAHKLLSTGLETNEPVVFATSATLPGSNPVHNSNMPQTDHGHTRYREPRICWNCSRPGHIARFCTQPPTPQYRYHPSHSHTRYQPRRNDFTPRQPHYQPRNNYVRPRFDQNRHPGRQQFFGPPSNIGDSTVTTNSLNSRNDRGHGSHHILVNGVLNGKQTTFFIDSGSNITLISTSWLQQHKITDRISASDVSVK